MKNFFTLASVSLALCCGTGFAADKPATAADKAADKVSGAADTAKDKVSGAAETTKERVTTRGDASDRKLLADVRRAVVKDKSLSRTAHNIKMSAKGGVVTLRGGVRSEDEKSKIESIAQQVAGVSSVQNNLTVKGQTAAATTTDTNTTTRRTQ
jgi:hyperosmotically inducible periplasmic protein